MMYGLDGVWSYLVPFLYLLINGLFALFVTGLGIYAIARGWGVRALSGLRFVGAGLVVWGLSDALGELVWFVTRVFDLSDVFYDLLGPGLQRAGYAGLHAWTALLTAISLGLLVFGAVGVVRSLALRPEGLAGEADLPDEPAIDIPEEPAIADRAAAPADEPTAAQESEEDGPTYAQETAPEQAGEGEPSDDDKPVEAQPAPRDPDAEATVVDTVPVNPEPTDEVSGRPTDPAES